MIEQFRTLLHTRPFDPAELNADDQQALLNLFQAARKAQNGEGDTGDPGRTLSA
jgi:myo-inositol catabolism protein IolC